MSALTSGLLATRLVRCWVTCYTLRMLVGYLVQAWLVVSSFLASPVSYLLLVCNTSGFLFIFVVLLARCMFFASLVGQMLHRWWNNGLRITHTTFACVLCLLQPNTLSLVRLALAEISMS